MPSYNCAAMVLPEMTNVEEESEGGEAMTNEVVGAQLVAGIGKGTVQILCPCFHHIPIRLEEISGFQSLDDTG